MGLIWTEVDVSVDQFANEFVEDFIIAVGHSACFIKLGLMSTSLSLLKQYQAEFELEVGEPIYNVPWSGLLDG